MKVGEITDGDWYAGKVIHLSLGISYPIKNRIKFKLFNSKRDLIRVCNSFVNYGVRVLISKKSNLKNINLISFRSLKHFTNSDFRK